MLYRANYHCDGSCDLVYDNKKQSVDLHTVGWCYAGRCRKVHNTIYYHSNKLFTQPSAAAALPKICYSSIHWVDRFADDLTVIPKDFKSHQQVLSSLILRDIRFVFYPQKCISLYFNSHHMISSSILNG